MDGNNILKKYDQISQMQDCEMDGFASDNFGQKYKKMLHTILKIQTLRSSTYSLSHM
jgi:hypothetical protein